jgi:osmotically inducible protein OsmC
MAVAERTARVVWRGTLREGQGELSTVSSGVLAGTPVSWAARTEQPSATSPEELLAGAHAACYAMALSGLLAREETPPDSLEVEATCSFDRSNGGFRVSVMDLRVRGTVPGLDGARFEDAARRAEQGCPISNAIRGNVEIRLTAELAS